MYTWGYQTIQMGLEPTDLLEFHKKRNVNRSGSQAKKVIPSDDFWQTIEPSRSIPHLSGRDPKRTSSLLLLILFILDARGQKVTPELGENYPVLAMSATIE